MAEPILCDIVTSEPLRYPIKLRKKFWIYRYVGNNPNRILLGFLNKELVQTPDASYVGGSLYLGYNIFMLKELQDIGLSEKEAKVYLAALDIGRATADQLAKQAKIVRSTTYVQLESLMKKGLMSTYEEGKKTYFAPESPEYLKRLFELKKKELEARESELADFLPSLIEKFEGAGERPIVRFFNGKEGITAMREETLELKRDEEIMIIYCYDALKKIYSENELREYTNRRSEKGIRVRSIYTRKEGPLERGDITPLATRRFIPYEQMPLSSDFFIFRDKVAIMALGNPTFGFVVESKEVAKSFKLLFSLIWNVGKE